MQHTKCKYVLAFVISSSLMSCKNYSVSLNDNVVYVPPPLFKDFTIADSHLRACIEQTIIDSHATKPEDIKTLNCSNAGISNLAGLEIFHSIEQLNLAENALTTTHQLVKLGQLKVLSLRKNSLTSTEPLLHLLHLRELDISENTTLACGDIKQLQANFPKGELKAILPEQCKAGS